MLYTSETLPFEIFDVIGLEKILLGQLDGRVSLDRRLQFLLWSLEIDCK